MRPIRLRTGLIATSFDSIKESRQRPVEARKVNNNFHLIELYACMHAVETTVINVFGGVMIEHAGGGESARKAVAEQMKKGSTGSGKTAAGGSGSKAKADKGLPGSGKTAAGGSTGKK